MNGATYLERLFGGTEGLLSFSWLSGDRMTSFAVDDAAEGLRRIGLLNGDASGVYVRMTTLREYPPEGRRGGADLSHELTCVFADIDFGVDGHAHDVEAHNGLRLPADEAEARSVVSLAGLPEPTLWVNSGGGLYPLWLLADPWLLETAADRRAATGLVRRWNEQLASGAAAAGLYHGAGVSDLARVLRLPGTVNRKIEGTPRPCRVVGDDGPTFTVEQLTAALDAAEMTHGVEVGPPPGAPESRYSDEERAQFDFREAVDPRVEDRLKLGPGIRGVLLSAGWSECDCGRTDCLEHYTRPGEPASPHSAHTLPENPYVLVVHSAEAGLPDGAGQRLTAARLYAHLYHDGDMAEAHRALLASEHGDGGVLAPYGWGSRSLVDTLFDATPTLRHIRTAAHARKLDETGPLLNVIGLRACAIPVERKIPALIGSRKGINLMLGTVGESASGKTASHELALELMDMDETEAAQWVRPLGSAQGIAEQYMGKTVNDEGKSVRGAMHGRARFFLEDEVDAISAKGESASDAAFSELRKAYSGSMLGQTNATEERNRVVPGGTYRFVLLTNIQPGRSQGLFTDAQIRSGTPQRFVMLPAKLANADQWRRRKAEGALPEWPGPLDLPPSEFSTGDFEVSDDEILSEIDSVYFESRDTAEGELRGHRQLTKLKVAAVLADMHGESVINAQWWELAEIIMMISDAQIALCRSRILEIKAAENKAVGTALGYQQFEIARTRDELEGEETETVIRMVLEHLDEQGPSTRNDMKGKFSSRRRKVLTEVLDGMVDDGLIDRVKERTDGRPRVTYRRVEES